MPKLITSVDLRRLENIEENKDLLTNEFLTDLTKDVTQFVSDTFFQGKASDPNLVKEGQDKIKVLNHTISLPYKIATIKAKFAGIPQTNIQVKDLKEQILGFVYGGYTVFAIDETEESGRPVINTYDPEQYIKGIDNDWIITYLQDEKNQSYLFIKEYSNIEPGKIKNLLYKIKAGTNGIYGDSVPLETLDQTAKLEEEYDMETDGKVLFTLHDFKIKNRVYGTAQVDMVKGLVNQLNIELVNVKDQFLKHVQAKLAIQGIDAAKMPKDEDGNILIRQAEALFLQQGAQAPSYISNKNELLKDVINIIDFYIKQISTTLSVPLELVGQSGQIGTESTESKLLRYSDFVKDIELIRDGLKEMFGEMFETIVNIYPKYTADLEEKEFYCIYDNVMPKDTLALANELNIAVMGGFLSKYTATKKYTDFEGKELEEEIARIADEQAKSIDNVDIF